MSAATRERRLGRAARRARGRGVPAPAAQQLLRHGAARRGWPTRTRSSTAPAGAGPSCSAAEGRHFCAGLDFAVERGTGHRRALPPGPAALRGAAARGGGRAGRGHRGRPRARALGGLPGGDGGQPLQRELRPPRLPPRLRADRDAARRSSGDRPPPTCCSPGAASAATRRSPSACATAWPATPRATS